MRKKKNKRKDVNGSGKRRRNDTKKERGQEHTKHNLS